MLPAILRPFPPATHPLTLVSDPDSLLTDEAVLAALAERGFTLLNEPDPIHLRHRLSQTHPPRIIVTGGPLNQLPYDLWQTGHHVTLALHTFYPNLAYPLLQALTPAQRARLAVAPPPPARLSANATAEYLLQHVFELGLTQPASLIDWLSRLHTRLGPLPAPLLAVLLEKLTPAFADWPLPALLSDPAAFTDFINTHWHAYLQTGKDAQLPFGHDRELQDTLPRLIRERQLTPVEIPNPGGIPDWARAGVRSPDADPRPARFTDLLLSLQGTDFLSLSTARWEDWQRLAWHWAELNALRHDRALKLPPEALNACPLLQKSINDAFFTWLKNRYTPLAGQRLPIPHQLFHVPQYLARQMRQQASGKIALLILDGASLTDWTILRTAWKTRYPAWHLSEHLLLAQIPSLTAVSRQALVSGQRPAEFDATLHDNRAEPRHWANFWSAQGLPADAAAYEHLHLEKDTLALSPRTQALCLIDTALDEISHHTLLGAADAQASLRLWLDTRSPALETLLDDLLAQHFTVYLTSDHGHTEAAGIGQPSEGLLVQTRSKRARVYRDEHTARKVQTAFAQTHLWHNDGLLPDDVWVLIADSDSARLHPSAFAPDGEIFVTHGGLSLDEMIVPLVQISRPR